jgi:hypothetical protein
MAGEREAKENIKRESAEEIAREGEPNYGRRHLILSPQRTIRISTIFQHQEGSSISELRNPPKPQK